MNGCYIFHSPYSYEFENTKVQLTKYDIPEYEQLKEIVQRPYIIHIYDCSNKAADYVDILEDKNYIWFLVFYDVKGKENYLHVVVGIVNRNNKILYIDPSTLEYTKNDSVNNLLFNSQGYTFKNFYFKGKPLWKSGYSSFEWMTWKDIQFLFH